MSKGCLAMEQRDWGDWMVEMTRLLVRGPQDLCLPQPGLAQIAPFH